MMTETIKAVGGRELEAAVDPMFPERWSPRAFSPDPIPDETLRSLFEAARWAPSCFNEQPWLFLYAAKPADLEAFRQILTERNRLWASKAPVLAFVFARRSFAKNGKPNRWASFDTGAAWMSLALEARRLGLDTHGMGGYDEEKAYELTGVPKSEYEVIAAIAIGRRGDPSTLPPDMAEQEKPNQRKPLASVAIEGAFRKI